tara:strand:- start:474 stop:743 length:270 start_codon:yes stop_codon:yes gene_type:complete
MPFYCSLCKNEEEYCYVSPFCSACLETKKIISLYGIERVNETLKEVFVRKEEQTSKRTDIIKQVGLPVKSEEERPIAVNTRSKKTGLMG